MIYQCKICSQEFTTRNTAKRETNKMREHRISKHAIREDEDIWESK